MLCFPCFSKHYLDLWVFRICEIHWSIYHPYTMLRVSYVSQNVSFFAALMLASLLT